MSSNNFKHIQKRMRGIYKSNPPTKIDSYPSGKKHIEKWTNSNNELHRDYDLPAWIEYNEDENVICEKYYLNGKLGRLFSLPSIIKYFDFGEVKESHYYKDGKKHRDNNLPSELHYKLNEVAKNVDGDDIEEIKLYDEDDDPTTSLKYKAYYQNDELIREVSYYNYFEIEEDDSSFVREYCWTPAFSCIKNYKNSKLLSTVEKDGNEETTTTYNEEGKLHSFDDEPSEYCEKIEYRDEFTPIYEKYYKNGQLHRENDKPAVILYKNGVVYKREWYLDNEIYREDQGEDSK